MPNFHPLDNDQASAHIDIKRPRDDINFIHSIPLSAHDEPRTLPYESGSPHEEAHIKAAPGSISDSLRHWYDAQHNTYFVRCVIITIMMILWPWIFFGAVWGLGGIQMHNSAARIVHKHPQDTAFFITSICTIICAIIGGLFSNAVVNLAQKMVAHKSTAVSRISFFTSLKNLSFPSSLFRQRRIRLFVIVVFYISIFTFVTPGITALLTPVPFNRKVTLIGSELDFASTNDTCISWFNNNTIPHTCDWEVSFLLFYNDTVPYTLIMTGIQGFVLH